MINRSQNKPVMYKIDCKNLPSRIELLKVKCLDIWPGDEVEGTSFDFGEAILKDLPQASAYSRLKHFIEFYTPNSSRTYEMYFLPTIVFRNFI